MRNANTVVFIQLALGMILFGSATPISKIVTDAMPVFVASLGRVTLGALVLFPFARRHFKEVSRLTRSDWIAIAGIAIFGMVGFSALMLYGMRMITGVAGAIVMATTPAVTAMGAMMLFGEKATMRKIAAIGLAVAGVLILQSSGAGDDGMNRGAMLIGAGLVFGAVCCEAAYTLLGRKVSNDVSPILVAFIAAAASVPIFAVVSFFQLSGFSPEDVSIEQWIALAWYGAGTLAAGSALWYSGLSKTQGSIAAVFMGLMPVSALVLSYVLLGEAFRWVHLAGFAVVFSSVLLISWEHARTA